MGWANQVYFHSTFICRGSELISILLCERTPYLIFAAGLSLFSNHIIEWINVFLKRLHEILIINHLEKIMITKLRHDMNVCQLAAWRLIIATASARVLLFLKRPSRNLYIVPHPTSLFQFEIVRFSSVMEKALSMIIWRTACWSGVLHSPDDFTVTFCSNTASLSGKYFSTLQAVLERTNPLFLSMKWELC